MRVYDGRDDKKAPVTKRTVHVVSASRIDSAVVDSMTIRKHGREDWSMFFCETGCMYFENTCVKDGQLWIYPPGVPQKYTVYRKDGTSYRYLHFTGSDVEQLLQSLEIPVYGVLHVKNGSVADIFEKIQNSIANSGALSMLKAEYHTLELISRIAAIGKQPTELSVMKRVTDDMEHSFAAAYDAARYARMLRISVSRFNHLFKACVGVSPYAYCMQLRMTNARSLLEDTDLQIKEIAERCGYKDALYFTQAFKKETGSTPSAYRKTNSTMK